jgi:hypothetical protein
MVGEASEIWLEHPGPDGLVLELDLNPFIAAPHVTGQRLSVAARGVSIGQFVLNGGGVFGFFIPASLLVAPGPVRLTFLHPDWKRPSDLGNSPDVRQLAIAVRDGRLMRLRADRPASMPMALSMPDAAAPSQADISADELVTRFESLGDNCEFGLVQRRCGAEPLGLLRFSNIDIVTLRRAIRCGFSGLGEAGSLEFLDDADEKEYVVRESVFGITYHTFVYKDEESKDGLLARQSNRLKFLGRKLMEDIRNAEKIFVVKRNYPLQATEVLPLFMVLNEYAPNTLLWVTLADETHPPGSVDYLLPGLLRGFVDKFAPSENAHDLSFDVWLELCTKAAKLVGLLGSARDQVGASEGR